MIVLPSIIFVLLASAIAQVPQATTEGWAKLVAPFESQCRCGIDVDPSLIPKWIYNYSFPQDPCLKCYMKCVFVHLHVLNPDGSINQEVNSALNKYVPGRTDAITIPCAAKVSNVTDLCDKAFKFCYCVQTGIINSTQGING